MDAVDKPGHVMLHMHQGAQRRDAEGVGAAEQDAQRLRVGGRRGR